MDYYDARSYPELSPLWKPLQTCIRDKQILLRALRGVVLGEWPSYESWVARADRFGLTQEDAEKLVAAMKALDKPCGT